MGQKQIGYCMTLDYYNNRTDEFIERTVNADMSSAYGRFEKYLDGKKILDAACGSGRDSKYFLEQGYDVTAFDASAKLVEAASAYIGINVELMTFTDMEWESEFDGIWASACLLHCVNDQLNEIISRFINALKPGGVWYMSFKEGTDESTDETGRPFIAFTTETLQALLTNHKTLLIEELWTEPSPIQPETTWVNAIVQKQPL